jgi:hypothetical protein
MTAILDRLAQIILHGTQAELESWARDYQAKQDRRKATAAPRVQREKATRAQQDRIDSDVREFVFGRAGGRCEICLAVPPVEWHHLMPGPLRRRYSTTTGTLAVCFACHREWHRGMPAILQLSCDAATRIGAPDIVQAALNRRLQKVTP